MHKFMQFMASSKRHFTRIFICLFALARPLPKIWRPLDSSETEPEKPGNKFPRPVSEFICDSGDRGVGNCQSTIGLDNDSGNCPLWLLSNVFRQVREKEWGCVKVKGSENYTGHDGNQTVENNNSHPCHIGVGRLCNFWTPRAYGEW